MGTKVDFKHFMQKVDRCARALVAHNVNKGDVVTIISANIPEALATIYATNKIGAVANIVHPLSSEADIQHALNLTNSRFLFVIDVAFETTSKVLKDTSVEDVVLLSPRDSLFGLMRLGYDLTTGRKLGKIELKYRQYTYKEFISRFRAVTEDVDAGCKLDDPAVVLYSGGTTGTPKGILLTNRSFNADVLQCSNADKTITHGKIILGILPIFHGFGLCYGFHVGLCNGLTNIMVPKFDPKTFHKLISKHRPNIILGVPALFEAMLANKKIREMDLSCIEMTICGGDTVTTKLKDEVDELVRKNGGRAEIQRGYGLTEYLAGAIFTPREHQKPGCIGVPLADVYVKIVEPNTDIEKPYDEIGEIVIYGPSTMVGYLNEPEETNKTLIKHGDGRVWLHTGDLGRMDDEGFVFFEQRLKRMIISSGYNVYPNHIEAVIGEIKEVLTVTVVGMADKYRGQVAKAFVVLREGVKGNSAMKQKIMTYCKKNLPKYSLPWEIEFRESLPKTKLNKIAYRELEKGN